MPPALREQTGEQQLEKSRDTGLEVVAGDSDAASEQGKTA